MSKIVEEIVRATAPMKFNEFKSLLVESWMMVGRASTKTIKAKMPVMSVPFVLADFFG